jgi:phosphohistidine phosphatase
MVRLLLLRHAKAERSEPGQDDHARALDERGRKDAAKIGSYMKSHSAVPDLALVSPARRTMETWKYLAGALGTSPTMTPAEALYDATAHTILEAIASAGGTAKTVLAIAHNPGLHDAAVLLIAAGDIEPRERLREGLPTSGLAIVSFAIDDWRDLRPQSGRLERFITPRSFDDAAN